MLDDWSIYADQFIKVMPIEYLPKCSHAQRMDRAAAARSLRWLKGARRAVERTIMVQADGRLDHRSY